MHLVVRPLINGDELAAWARKQGFRNLVPTAWHVTLINSRRRLNRAAIELDRATLHLPPSSERHVTRMGDFIVLTIVSLELSERHAALRATGADCDYPDYTPHVTFTTGRGRDLDGIEPFSGSLIFGPEVMEPQWADC